MLEWMLVKKYIKYDNTQPFISITSFLAFIGVALGVSVLMITMAITNGLSGEFKKKLFSMNYPLTIKSSYFGNVGDSLLNDIKKNIDNDTINLNLFFILLYLNCLLLICGS